MRNVITEPVNDSGELALPWEIFVKVFRYHLMNKMLQRGMAPTDIYTYLNDPKSFELVEEIAKEMFASVEPNEANCAITFGDRQSKQHMELITTHPEGAILKLTPVPELTIDEVEAAIAKAYPDYTVWTDGVDRVYVDEGDDDPILMSPKDAYQTYITDAGK